MIEKTKQKQKALPPGDRSEFLMIFLVAPCLMKKLFLCRAIVRESADFVKHRFRTEESSCVRKGSARTSFDGKETKYLQKMPYLPYLRSRRPNSSIDSRSASALKSGNSFSENTSCESAVSHIRNPADK